MQPERHMPTSEERREIVGGQICVCVVVYGLTSGAVLGADWLLDFGNIEYDVLRGVIWLTAAAITVVSVCCAIGKVSSTTTVFSMAVLGAVLFAAIAMIFPILASV
jgi:hypothetical protein